MDDGHVSASHDVTINTSMNWRFCVGFSSTQNPSETECHPRYGNPREILK